MKLEGKIALVTGASQGLGRAIALKLAANGADVAIIYVGPEEPALETKGGIEALGRRAVCYPCDVRDEQAVEATVAQVKKDLGKVDILVNNAGVTRDGLMVTMKDEDYDMVLDINLKGAFHMIRACYRDFMRKRSGKIINISSIAGLGGQRGPGKLRRQQGGAHRPFQERGQGAGQPGRVLQLHCPRVYRDRHDQGHQRGQPPAGAGAHAEDGHPRGRGQRGPVPGLPRERLHHRGDHPRGRRPGYMRRVVVTGLGCVTPVGNDVPTFWESLKAGKCGIGPITHFDTTEHKAKVAAEVKDFDPLQYMEKSDLRKYDIFCQYAMAAATQAVEESGVKGTLPPERIGTYFGSGIGGMHTFAEEQKTLMEKGPRRVSPFFVPGMIINMAGGLIAIKYNFQGASIPIVTACATGNNAIGEAYRAIKHGYLDAVLTGGAEAAIIPIGVAGFSNMKALSTQEDPSIACTPFDARRSGFVMGEGAGALMLEEYEHAVARGAKIYGELCGYGVTCDAYHITAPQPDGQGGAAALKMALEEAGGCEDYSKLYINAHGTSTPLNDACETKAIKTALGEEAARQCMVSSTKSMTGHMLGAAGAVEAIACVLAVKEGIVPPTIGYEVPDPECDLDYVPNQAREAQVDLALSASLGFGGHNAYLAFRRV